MLFRTATILALVLAALFTGLATERASAAVRVAAGDTLSAIAAENGTTVKALASVNGIKNPNLVRVGQSLKLPGRASAKSPKPVVRRYTVAEGDTLSAIAARHGTSLSALASRNGIKNLNIVVLGTSLKIPGTAAAKTASSSPRRYRVRAGDSVAKIAARFGTTSRAIVVANRIKNPNVIVTGRILRVPRADAAPKALPSATSTEIATVKRSGTASVPKAEVRRLIDKHSAKHGVDSGLTRAIAWQESGFQQTVVSHTGAVGVMQLMPETAQWIGQDLLGRKLDPGNVNDNVEGGVAFVKWLNSRAQTREEAIAGYYQGLRSVRTRGLYDDTQQYVRSVVALTGTV